MDWKDIAGLVGKVAPLLGTAIAGPAGGAVGALVAAALGVEDKPDAVAQALQLDPQAAVKLAEIASTQKIELERLVITGEANQLAARTREFEIEVDDRKDARARQIALRDPIPAIITLTALVAVIGALFMLITGLAVFPKEYELTVGGLIAALVGVLGAGVGFYLGTTRSSAEKNQIIKTLSK